MSYSHTVVGIFDSDIDSQDAVDALIDSGFDRKDIDINNRRNVNGPSVNYQTDSDERHHAHSDKNESAITRFFKTIFGDNSDDADKHARLAVEGGAVVTVYTNSVEQAARAADILDAKGAIDVDDRASKYGYQTGANTTLNRSAATSPAMNSDTPYTPGSQRTSSDAEINENGNKATQEGMGATA